MPKAYANSVGRHVSLSNPTSFRDSDKMLTGPAFGKAIRLALEKAGMSQAALARHFGVTPSSVTSWLNRGTVEKHRLPKLWRLFAEVVPPEHWGLPPGTVLGPEVLSGAASSATSAHLAGSAWSSAPGADAVREAVLILAQALRQPMPDDMRADVADALHRLAIRSGAEWQAAAVASTLAHAVSQAAAGLSLQAPTKRSAGGSN